MIEKKDIGQRLENWARWNNAPARRIAASQTAAICDRLRRAELGDDQVAGERRKIDEDDAVLLERNMRHLVTQHRLLLWYCYIQNCRPEIVCRRLSIPNKPATEFVAIFRAAQAAIEKYVDNEQSQQ